MNGLVKYLQTLLLELLVALLYSCTSNNHEGRAAISKRNAGCSRYYYLSHIYFPMLHPHSVQVLIEPFNI